MPIGSLRGALAAAVLLALTPAEARAACADADVVPRSPEQVEAAEQALACLINEERAARGRARLDVDPRLAAAAEGHAADMVRRDFFSHVSPGGSTVADRIRRAGYARGASSWAFGEVLAWGTGSRARPASLVASWMRSPGHRAALLDPRFRDVGPGLAAGTPRRAQHRPGVTAAVTFGRR